MSGQLAESLQLQSARKLERNVSNSLHTIKQWHKNSEIFWNWEQNSWKTEKIPVQFLRREIFVTSTATEKLAGAFPAVTWAALDQVIEDRKEKFPYIPTTADLESLRQERKIEEEVDPAESTTGEVAPTYPEQSTNKTKNNHNCLSMPNKHRTDFTNKNAQFVKIDQIKFLFDQRGISFDQGKKNPASVSGKTIGGKEKSNAEKSMLVFKRNFEHDTMLAY